MYMYLNSRMVQRYIGIQQSRALLGPTTQLTENEISMNFCWYELFLKQKILHPRIVRRISTFQFYFI